MSTTEGELLVEGIKDRVIWAPSKSDIFLCRSFKRLIASERLVLDRWRSLWDLPVPLKVKCFTWLLLKGKLAMRGTLQRLGLVSMRVMCVLFAKKTKRRPVTCLFIVA